MLTIQIVKPVTATLNPAGDGCMTQITAAHVLSYFRDLWVRHEMVCLQRPLTLYRHMDGSSR
jgi:hypothetical protein